MKLEEFNSGNYSKQFEYQSFSPALINMLWTWDSSELNVMLEKAMQELAELNAFSLIVPNVDLFIEMHITKEANQSSKIEGTQTSINEVVLDIENISPEKKDDWQEVHNYINSINYAIKELKKIPLSNRLLKTIHMMLMKGVRGEHKTPGEFRSSQNWIGGSNLTDAIFIPPHDSEVAELMSDLEKFWHNEEIKVPHLIKIALSHYQFETIHPFLDGNGRVGRILITLYLINFNILDKPSFYLSDFFVKHRASYYDALMRVRTSNNIVHWIKFFLNAIITTAENGKSTFKDILKLKSQIDAQIVTLNKRAEKGKVLIEYFYKKPILSYDEVCKKLNIAPNTANSYFRTLLNMGIIEEMTGYKRNRLYIFSKYLNLFM